MPRTRRQRGASFDDAATKRTPRNWAYYSTAQFRGGVTIDDHTFVSGHDARQIAVELPIDRHVPRQLLFREAEAKERDRHRALAQNLVVEILLAHLLRIDE